MDQNHPIKNRKILPRNYFNHVHVQQLVKEAYNVKLISECIFVIKLHLFDHFDLNLSYCIVLCVHTHWYNITRVYYKATSSIYYNFKYFSKSTANLLLFIWKCTKKNIFKPKFYMRRYVIGTDWKSTTLINLSLP